MRASTVSSVTLLLLAQAALNPTLTVSAPISATSRIPQSSLSYSPVDSRKPISRTVSSALPFSPGEQTKHARVSRIPRRVTNSPQTIEDVSVPKSLFKYDNPRSLETIPEEDEEDGEDVEPTLEPPAGISTDVINQETGDVGQGEKEPGFTAVYNPVVNSQVTALEESPLDVASEEINGVATDMEKGSNSGTSAAGPLFNLNLLIDNPTVDFTNQNILQRLNVGSANDQESTLADDSSNGSRAATAVARNQPPSKLPRAVRGSTKLIRQTSIDNPQSSTDSLRSSSSSKLPKPIQGQTGVQKNKRLEKTNRVAAIKKVNGQESSPQSPKKTARFSKLTSFITPKQTGRSKSPTPPTRTPGAVKSSDLFQRVGMSMSNALKSVPKMLKGTKKARK
ncbi:hypothetical protein IWQ60_008997 [Tieghemiomyces parasiticus]|uniref:Uncharacterized protein n=1 Tax=Tieghemiomyces parasiticus TaxID=78921 RepID=A0A9W7ZVG9_9FUNG|nr:hypothetical protein IWQ60_008997 [Tieghemiomyces parasiticus]